MWRQTHYGTAPSQGTLFPQKLGFITQMFIPPANRQNPKQLYIPQLHPLTVKSKQATVPGAVTGQSHGEGRERRLLLWSGFHSLDRCSNRGVKISQSDCQPGPQPHKLTRILRQTTPEQSLIDLNHSPNRSPGISLPPLCPDCHHQEAEPKKLALDQFFWGVFRTCQAFLTG